MPCQCYIASVRAAPGLTLDAIVYSCCEDVRATLGGPLAATEVVLLTDQNTNSDGANYTVGASSYEVDVTSYAEDPANANCLMDVQFFYRVTGEPVENVCVCHAAGFRVTKSM